MKKILVLGAAGMAGHVVYTYLKELKKYNVLGTTNSNNLSTVSIKLNIFDKEEVEKIIYELNPDIIINCIGILIRKSKSNPDQTIYGNAYFPYILKDLAQKNDAKLIHISTDCVFSGKKGGYTEDSFKDATDVYGLSKNLGEINDSDNLTIRTSIIGPELKQNGEGLFQWFMQQNNAVNGFKNNLWSGVTTLELSKFIDWTIENPLTGLVHLTNNEPISKFDLLHIINDVYEKHLTILDDKDYFSNKSFLNTNDTIRYKVPSYKQMLEEQKEFMQNHKIYYDDIYF